MTSTFEILMANISRRLSNQRRQIQWLKTSHNFSPLFAITPTEGERPWQAYFCYSYRSSLG